MNRTAARARVRQLLAWMETEMVTGACPQCGVVGEDLGMAPPEWQAEHGEAVGVPSTSPIHGLQFRHLPRCPLEKVNDELDRHVGRHRMRLQPVQIKADRGYVRVLRLVEEE